MEAPYLTCHYPQYFPSQYHAIWFHRKDKRRAFISIVNNKYRYEIYCSITGDRLIDDYEKTLPLAMKKVFKCFENL